MLVSTGWSASLWTILGIIDRIPNLDITITDGLS